MRGPRTPQIPFPYGVQQPRTPPMPKEKPQNEKELKLVTTSSTIAMFGGGAKGTRELAKEKAKHGDTRMLEYQKSYEEKKKRKQQERRAFVHENGWAQPIPDWL